jgi:LacI family transcriptional regulator
MTFSMQSGIPATINDVAASARVSVVTASRALNGKLGVKPETRERVLAAAQALRYAANGAARGLVTARTGTSRVVQLVTEPGPAVQILLATELVARRSCGCDPTASPAVSPP